MEMFYARGLTFRRVDTFGPELIRGRVVMDALPGATANGKPAVLLWVTSVSFEAAADHLQATAPDEEARLVYLIYAPESSEPTHSLVEKGRELYQAIHNLEAWADSQVGEAMGSPLFYQDLAHYDQALCGTEPANMTDRNRKELESRWNRVRALMTELDQMEAQAVA